MVAPLAASRLAERERTVGVGRTLTLQDKIDSLRVGGVVESVADARALLGEMGERQTSEKDTPCASR